jgi:hypothetical protein
MWAVREWMEREQHPIKSVVQLDYASRLRCAPDNRSIIIAAQAANTLQVYYSYTN